MLAAMAAIGMGLLGEPEVLERTAPWLLTEGDDEAVVFKRQCALIAMSYVGTAAPEYGDEARRIRAEVLERVRVLLRAEQADVRFQAAVALVEVGGNAVEHDLVDALATETHEEVRENLVAAISRLDPPGKAACRALVAILDDDDQGWRPIGFEAAMALAAARRPQAGPRLLAALERRGERDLALEALAALGRSAPADAIERTHRLARGLRTPGITRVRAAYALARMIAPSGAGSTDHVNPGTAMLRRLAWHPRPAVREAVADALAALRELGESSPAGPAGRRRRA
jgi:hypothetical protein